MRAGPGTARSVCCRGSSWSSSFISTTKDRELIAGRRRDSNRLGLALQLVTVRYLEMFLPDPLDVPGELVDYLAEQLEIADPSCVKSYIDREKTRFEHAWEIQRREGLVSFAQVEAELLEWIADQGWMTGDGPKVLLAGAVGWLRERNALLPGVTTLERLVTDGRHFVLIVTAPVLIVTAPAAERPRRSEDRDSTVHR
ncbi:DUF4158 domain-containing protein [Nocardia sp. NBC_01009]|nr:DUF4158 domain-containing protein [Nocardia sp. NBC_01009]